LSLRLDAIDDDQLADSDVPMTESDHEDVDDVNEDHENGDGNDGDEASEEHQQTTLSEAEIKRRADVVRQMLSEELSSGGGPLGSLNSLKVHGSESEWSKAIVGHGSDLSSLRVQLSVSDSRQLRDGGNGRGQAGLVPS
uniref:Ubiquitin-like domain-containing protein n=1 Tax=Echinostoma caproni TaxID=27848 RepID=A0A183B715_9TREM